MAETMKVVVVRPKKRAKIMEIENTLEKMQKLVGGYIEAYGAFEDGAMIICNEEGKLVDPEPNRAIYNDAGGIRDIVFGTFFICYAPPGSEDFMSLPDELAEKYLKKYAEPELILMTERGITIVK